MELMIELIKEISKEKTKILEESKLLVEIKIAEDLAKECGDYSQVEILNERYHNHLEAEKVIQQVI